MGSSKANCWEHLKCGREPGGDKVNKHGWITGLDPFGEPWSRRTVQAREIIYTPAGAFEAFKVKQEQINFPGLSLREKRHTWLWYGSVGLIRLLHIDFAVESLGVYCEIHELVSFLLK